jgi:hypothetical protein
MAFSPNVAVRNIPGLNIPQHDHVACAYYSGTNNLQTVTYREGGGSGTVVATINFTYTPTQPPTANDALLLNVTKS